MSQLDSIEGIVIIGLILVGLAMIIALEVLGYEPIDPMTISKILAGVLVAIGIMLLRVRILEKGAREWTKKN